LHALLVDFVSQILQLAALRSCTSSQRIVYGNSMAHNRAS